MLRCVAALVGAIPAVVAQTDIKEVATVPELSADSGCCVGGPLFNNERMPKSQAGGGYGGGCVGGCRGAPFTLHKEGGIVRSITVWYGGHHDPHGGIKAIRIAYFGDDEDHTVGKSSLGHYAYQKFDFQPGETIDGDVTLSGNGYETRAGYIAFSTSAGRKFAAGENMNTKFLFDSGNSFLSGIRGLSGDDIDQLAFIFWKPIRSLYFTSISYPTLDSLTKIKSPAVIASQDYCNDNSEPRPFIGESVKKTEMSGHDSCFTGSFTETFGQSITVKAGIPDLLDVTTETHWSISSTQEFKNCQQHSSSVETTLNFPSPTLTAHTRTSYQYTQWQGKLLDLPFQAKLEVRFDDGSSIERIERGTYAGTSYLSVQQSWTNEEKNIHSCNRGLPALNQTIVV